MEYFKKSVRLLDIWTQLFFYLLILFFHTIIFQYKLNYFPQEIILVEIFIKTTPTGNPRLMFSLEDVKEL